MTTSNPKPKKRCLLVEDELLVGEIVKMALEDAGFEVVGPIKDLSDAVDQATSEDFDVAVLDINIDGGDVFPAADILRERRIPFVFHTGHGNRRDLKGDYPGAPVFAKPSDEETMLQTLIEFTVPAPRKVPASRATTAATIH
jgi:CheY-like chemotaxis protein